MARRPRYMHEGEPVPLAIERHISDLGFRSARDYLGWCWGNGFEGDLDKSKSDMAEERDRMAEGAAKRAAQAKLHRNPKAFIEAVCAGDMSSDEIDRPLFKRAALAIEASNEDADYRASLKDMLTQMMKHGDLPFQTVAGFDEVPYMLGLVKLHDRKTLWLRPLVDFKPRSKNREKLFGELTHHLFDKYGDVPRFMEKVWLRDDRKSWRFRDWYIHLGRGHNLRTAKSPISLTKKMAHEFQFAPDDYTAEQAVRWGQMRALGADAQLVNAVAATRIGRSFEHEAFWFTVMRFFIDNPMLDPRQIGPIVDYLHNQKFVGQQVEVEPGRVIGEPPPQPGLSMRGRTVESVLKNVAEWHKALGDARWAAEGDYARSRFSGFSIERRTPSGPKSWNIRQLMNAADLVRESQALKHCVSSYHYSCAEGHCTIWSLFTKTSDGAQRRQTIEVDRNSTITQCRGLANSDPTAEEWSVVTAWAEAEGLSISGYLG